MEEIKWGIIGCGDVTEIKSGPAFNKVKNSSLVAVMRRDAVKAKDYAKRHGVPNWYNNANDLINDENVNAIYIATPPSFHLQYARAAIQAGKPVYVEKPMTLHSNEAMEMAAAAKDKNIKLVVAHYRREQPLFKKIKQLLTEKIIGEVSFVKLEFYKRPLVKEELLISKNAWRVNKEISGGGLFHDLAPHQLDLAYFFFGEFENAFGYSSSPSTLYHADDVVAGNILFTSGVIFNGTWCFNIDEGHEKDLCEIIGSQGRISFSVFGEPKIVITVNGKIETITFHFLEHVQQPMIEKVVEYFLGDAENPCSATDGVKVMQLIDAFTIPIEHK